MKESTKKKLRSFVEAGGTAPDRGLTDMVDIFTQEMIRIAAKKEKLQEELETIQEKIQEKIDELGASWNLTAVGSDGQETDYTVTLYGDGSFDTRSVERRGMAPSKQRQVTKTRGVSTPSDLLAVLKGFKITNWDRRY